jgi:RimJ/RimL family protein N-acetyltransferase
VFLGLRAEAQLVDVVDDLAQVVAAADLVADLAEVLADLVLDRVRAAGLLLEAVQVREELLVQEVAQVGACLELDRVLAHYEMAPMSVSSATHPPIASPLGDVRTARLELRRMQPGDLDALAAIFAVREVWQFPYGRGFTREETAEFLATQLRAWETNGFGLWIACERGRTLGFVGLSVPLFLPEILPAVEVGWRLHPDAWGQGYASEAARAALRAGFETLGLDEICSLPQSQNPASYRVCERLGMHFVREVAIPANERRGEVAARLYTLTRTQ